ncbi:hypothetical protein PAHAL_9G015400 [Panicum hallii]|uniref:Uncharacterized protein n=1 Tax=Panicum hallii TaxID=206008 RepID=A0A2T8HZU3_9POAL|nr:hypothetical protein PAHAL_9G015400 [Panicum hallii]
MGRPRPARRAAVKATGDPITMRRSRGAPSARAATARRSCSSPARAPLLLTSRAALALPSDGKPLRREGWRRLEQGGGEGSTLTHTRSTCTALLLPAPP